MATLLTLDLVDVAKLGTWQGELTGTICNPTVAVLKHVAIPGTARRTLGRPVVVAPDRSRPIKLATTVVELAI